MTLKLCFGIGIILTVAITSSFSLKCYHCRTNVCQHQYCTQANSLMETSDTTMASEAWKKIPICPEVERGLKDKLNADYAATCPKKAVACGRSIFNITTTSTKNILPVSEGNHTIIPVLGSGRESENSSVIVYGCVLPKFKSCPHGGGYSLKHQVPADQGNSSVGAVTDVITTNTEAACCLCEQDLCNDIEGSLNCHSQGPQSVSDTGIGTGGSGTVNSCSIVFIFIGSLVLASF